MTDSPRCRCPFPERHGGHHPTLTPARTPAGVTVPARGEFLVRDGKIMPVLESEMIDYVENDVSYTIRVKRDDDD